MANSRRRNGGSGSERKICDPTDDSHAFESIDLNADRESQRKLWKLSEAAEQADLERFRQRLLQHRGAADKNAPIEINSDGQCAFVGYGDQLYSEGVSGDSNIVSETRGPNEDEDHQTPSTSGLQKEKSCSSPEGSTGSASSDMDSSITVLTREEFHAMSSSLSPKSTSSHSENEANDKPIQEAASKFSRTHRTHDIDKYVKSNNEEKMKNLLADAMIDCNKKGSIASSPQTEMNRSFYNISGISSADTMETECNHIDGSPMKSAAPVNLSALLDRTILNDGSVCDTAASSTANISSDAVAVTDAADANESFNTSNDSNSTTSEDFVLVDRVNCDLPDD